jgi:hypothetical protein
MRTFLAILALSLTAACGAGADPAACEKGDDAQCQKLCETGKPEYQHYCFAGRARQVRACVEKDADCPAACELWKNATVSETTLDYYRTNLGDDKIVAAIEAKCGAAAPAAPATP